MSGWGTELPKGWARGIAIDDRRRPERRTGTVCAQVHTVSVSPQGKLRLHRVDVAFDEGFGFVNPLSVRKQIEGQIAFGYSDAMHQEVTIRDGRAVEKELQRLSIVNNDPVPQGGQHRLRQDEPVDRGSWRGGDVARRPGFGQRSFQDHGKTRAMASAQAS